MVLILWTFVGVVCFFHNYRTQELRQKGVKQRLEIINNRIIDLYNTHNPDRDKLVASFLQFVENYYHKTAYDDISVAIYDNTTGNVVQHIGYELPSPEVEGDGRKNFFKGSQVEARDSLGNIVELDPDKVFYYRVHFSDDGNYLVQTVVPYTTALSYTLDNSKIFLISVLLAGIVLTIMIYVFTLHLARNVVNLRTFVKNAIDDTADYNENLEFSNDELGDISRQIIKFYQQRSKALINSEKEHKMALKVIEDKWRSKRQMTNNINHELKNPLGIIKGYIDTILSNEDMSPEMKRHFLVKSQIQVNRLVEMLNDISTINRLEEGSKKVLTEIIDFHEVVFTVANDLTESGMCNQMEFVYDVPLDCTIRGNFNLLTAMLLNLAKNSVAYSGGTEMGVKLVSRSDKFMTFSFYDNGKGVSPEHLPHLFEYFYRVDSGRSRKSGGTGLGLPIVKNTIISFGGTISVRNRKGGGLEYLFTLPAVNETDEMTDEEGSTDSADTNAPTDNAGTANSEGSADKKTDSTTDNEHPVE
ncbi:MAG: HAMP domain-containing histidine kinase [Muribaculaceae bacterium]|nr:HAMP domain-containing histidine kinase [Muribaculaceae bacterium]